MRLNGDWKCANRALSHRRKTVFFYATPFQRRIISTEWQLFGTHTVHAMHIVSTRRLHTINMHTNDLPTTLMTCFLRRFKTRASCITVSREAENSLHHLYMYKPANRVLRCSELEIAMIQKLLLEEEGLITR